MDVALLCEMKTEVVAQMTKDSTWVHIFFIIIPFDFFLNGY